MKRVIIDMDNVMAEVNPQYKAFMKSQKNIDLDLKELAEKQEAGTVENYDVLHSFLTLPHFFGGMPIMANAQEVIREVNEKYEVFIVSAAMEYPNSLIEKLDWLAKNFPFIQTKQICFTGSKKFVCGDYMIDDKISNLKHFPGVKLLFDHPNNRKIIDPLYHRVRGWNEVAKVLL